MALIPFQAYVKDNPYAFTAAKLRHIIKTKPGAEKMLRRISSRVIFVDEDAVEEFINSQKFYTFKRGKKSAEKK